jgi:hypothetical protein
MSASKTESKGKKRRKTTMVVAARSSAGFKMEGIELTLSKAREVLADGHRSELLFVATQGKRTSNTSMSRRHHKQHSDDQLPYEHLTEH